MKHGDRFAGQDWGKIREQLTAFAHRRTHKRSMALAQDLAQTAIGDLLTHPETWEPEVEPLLKHLARRVIGLASNEWNRKRTSLEVLFEEEGDDAPDAEKVEDDIEDVIDRRRLAARFRAGLEDVIAGDEDAHVVVALLADGQDTPAAMAKASGLPIGRLRDARRRVFYHAKALAKRMGEDLDAADDARLDGGESLEDTEQAEEEEEVGQ